MEDQAARRRQGLPHARPLWASFRSRRCFFFPPSCLLLCANLSPSLRAEEMDKRAPISVKFEIPYFTVSGQLLAFAAPSSPLLTLSFSRSQESKSVISRSSKSRATKHCLGFGASRSLSYSDVELRSLSGMSTTDTSLSTATTTPYEQINSHRSSQTRAHSSCRVDGREGEGGRRTEDRIGLGCRQWCNRGPPAGVYLPCLTRPTRSPLSPCLRSSSTSISRTSTNVFPFTEGTMLSSLRDSSRYSP